MGDLAGKFSPHRSAQWHLGVHESCHGGFKEKQSMVTNGYGCIHHRWELLALSLVLYGDEFVIKEDELITAHASRPGGQSRHIVARKAWVFQSLPKHKGSAPTKRK